MHFQLLFVPFQLPYQHIYAAIYCLLVCRSRLLGDKNLLRNMYGHLGQLVVLMIVLLMIEYDVTSYDPAEYLFESLYRSMRILLYTVMVLGMTQGNLYVYRFTRLCSGHRNLPFNNCILRKEQHPGTGCLVLACNAKTWTTQALGWAWRYTSLILPKVTWV